MYTVCGPDCIRKNKLTQSETPPNSRRVLLQVTVQHVCLLCPSGVAIVEDSHYESSSLVSFSPERGKVWENPLFLKAGFCVKVCEITAQTLDRWRDLDFYVGYHYYNPHGN